MICLRAYKYRIYPDREQRGKLAVQFGHARFVYNYALNARKEYYKKTGKGLSYSATAKMLPGMKKELEWLREADSQVLQQKLRDLDRAYVNFFQKRAAYPRFRSKHSRQSVRYPQRFRFIGNRIRLPKVGDVKIVLHRHMDGVAKNVTVSKIKSGKYFASVQCEIVIPVSDNGLPAVGVDLGIRHFAILSTGEKVAHPSYLRKSEKRLVRLQRWLSKKKKGSVNRLRMRLKIARLHEHIADQRKDFLDKLSHWLTTQFGAIGLESLNVSGMVRNHCLAKSVSDSGWGMFVRQCEYKAAVNGSSVHHADRFFPSSKMCNICGTVNSDLKLGDRIWTCENCGTEHDRDINAAVNLKNLCTVGATGFKACGESVSPDAFQAIRPFSVKQEAQRL
ncbi:transposase [Desulfonema ishimotonii]|uniref:Transposase n=1 Tax=Desulfonema ishimotonii TaxID=45657 RepID=A0A401FRK7_9BACT|nr:RNA-guided endonuclease TnpB family protein [Desulfonema ishimotonii]GBC59599.1 transposase [Desulfonema ishimotonii]